MGDLLSCFMAYDVRGRVPDELNDELAFKIGQAFAAVFKPDRVAVGHDIRLSGPALTTALADGLMAAGVDVVHLGLCGTEEIYFAAFHLEVDGAIIVTASHNPADFNGMKFVRKGAVPVSADSGLGDIEKLAAAGNEVRADRAGKLTSLDNRPAYIEHLLSYVDAGDLKPLKIVANPGNGGAGPVMAALAGKLPFEVVSIMDEPDGTFPNGVPNPLLKENREMTGKVVREQGADLGIAWDGDFDRCFFFDERGEFIEGYYLVGLLAEAMLADTPGSKIIHDPRLIWNTEDVVKAAGGTPVMCRTGHAFIKERMRQEDALYGGEMSAHHYFRDFAYCDSGMIPWLLITRLLSSSGRTLSDLVAARMDAYPVSGEINNVVDDPDGVIATVKDRYRKDCLAEDYTDGLSLVFADYRFNIRKSNTEPLLRLNVEARGDKDLLAAKTRELLAIITAG